MPERRPRSELLERVLSASAALVALSALVVSTYQTKIMRDQQKASAWPYLLQGNSGVDTFGRIVQNVGLGPALVRSFVVEVDDRPVHYWAEVRDAVERHEVPRSGAKSYGSTLRRGMVLLPGSPFEIFHTDDLELARGMRATLNDRRVRMRVCYCSLYGDCWTADTRADEPVPTRECPADSTREFIR